MTITGSINLNIAFFFAPVGLNMLHIILNVFGNMKTTLHDRT